MKILIAAVIIVFALAAIIALPTISIDADAVVASNAFSYIRAAMYFIPVNTAGRILAVILALWVWRVIVSIVKLVWDLLPVA